MEYTLSGQILDIISRRTYPGRITVKDGVIFQVEETASATSQFITPGFIDAHIHIESSMLTPTRFATLAVRHGTIGTVSDPHEIANVLGVAGIEFMIESASQVPLKITYGVPSCVPATTFESAGAILDSSCVAALLERDELVYLSEMMNYPGVLQEDPEVMAKIAAARACGKRIDGHAPGLRGDDVRRYVEAGISTDHECFTIEEAQDKLAAGMKIIIREGSAAKNFDTLIPLMHQHADRLMFCSDDRHPDDLRDGHINELVARALQQKYDLYDVWRAASLNPIEHYGLQVGCLRVGDPADFLIMDSLEAGVVRKTYLDGVCVAENQQCLFDCTVSTTPNVMSCEPIDTSALTLTPSGSYARVIRIVPGQLVTESFQIPVTNPLEPSQLMEQDIIKLVVYNRYQQEVPALALVQGFSMGSGAIASTIAHDSHNIIAAGCSDEDIAIAVNALIKEQGGISFVSGAESQVLPLPVAGLMTDDDGFNVAERYEAMSEAVKATGSTLPAPFMTLSFLALLVIPELKLSDKGLFDGESFSFAPLFFDVA